MNRDVDLQREILLKIEAIYEPGQYTIFDLEIDSYSKELIAEHCDLLEQDGYIKFYKPSLYMGGGMDFEVGNITSKGYDFLDSVRDPETWEKVKSKADEKSLPKTITNLAKIAGIFTGSAIKEINGG